MAEYTYRQWENEMNEENNIHADDCYRWQAGIELAGGTWDGTWVDLDKTGKGLVTIDQFNALESQIQSKVSSYTPKNYDPDSTVQIVPGVDGWNKVEDGILKAICTPDGVNRNFLVSSKALNVGTAWNGGFYTTSGQAPYFVREEDSDGFGVISYTVDSTARMGWLVTSMSCKKDLWANKQMMFSVDFLADNLAETINQTNYRIREQVFGSNNGSSYSSIYTGDTIYFNAASNVDEFKNGEWVRVKIPIVISSMADMGLTGDEYDIMVYTVGFQISNANTGITVQFKKPKLELADDATDWSEAPEDFGWPDNTEL